MEKGDKKLKNLHDFRIRKISEIVQLKIITMPRSKNSVASRARRKRVLKAAKGYYGKRKNVYTVAKNVMEKGMTYSYVGRKLKKREYRALWIARINAAVRAEGMTYSQFIHKLNEKNIDLNRKILADMAMNEAESFKSLIQSVK